MSVVWRPAASNDIIRIYNYLFDLNPEAAKRIAADLLRTGDGLFSFPRRGRPGNASGTREITTVRPYIIVYEVDGADNVTILRIWHSAQHR